MLKRTVVQTRVGDVKENCSTDQGGGWLRDFPVVQTRVGDGRENCSTDQGGGW